MAGDQGDEVERRFLPLESDTSRFGLHAYFTVVEGVLTTFAFTIQGDQGPPGLPGPEEVKTYPPHSFTDSPPKGEKVMTEVVLLYMV